MRATDADVLQAATVGATPQASSASLLVKDWRAWALGVGMVVLIVAGPIWIETVRRPETAVRTRSETASLDDPSQLSAVASAAEPGNPGPPPEPTDQSRELAPAPSAVVAAAPAGAGTKPEPPVRADELVAAYQRNAIAADRRYKGQIVDIAGAVVWVGKDVFGNPYVTFGRDGATSVQATFPRGSDNILADLSPDQPIVVRCRVEGKLVSVSVRDCLLQ